jgi:hypothetical protein
MNGRADTAEIMVHPETAMKKPSRMLRSCRSRLNHHSGNPAPTMINAESVRAGRSPSDG